MITVDIPKSKTDADQFRKNIIENMSCDCLRGHLLVNNFPFADETLMFSIIRGLRISCPKCGREYKIKDFIRTKNNDVTIFYERIE